MNATTVIAACCAAVLIAVTGCGSQEPPKPAEVAPTDSSTEVKVVEDSALAAPTTVEVASEPVIPDVVATIGAEQITGEELQEAMARMRPRGAPGGSTPPMSDEQQRRLVDSLVKRKVLTLLAGQSTDALEDEEVERVFEEQKTRFDTQEKFAAYLAQTGFTEEELKKAIREDLTIRAYIDEATKDAAAVTDEEIAETYESFKASGRLERPQETVDVSHILVRVEGEDEAAWSAGKETIDAARARVVGGEDFAAVAKDVSDDPGSAQRGGAYPETSRGKMVPEFEERMFTLPVGEVSEPFRTQFGWHVLTVTAKHEAGTMTLAEVEGPLRDHLSNKKKQEAVEKLISDARAGLNIQILYPPTPDSPDAAGDAPVEAGDAPVEAGDAPVEAGATPS